MYENTRIKTCGTRYPSRPVTKDIKKFAELGYPPKLEKKDKMKLAEPSIHRSLKVRIKRSLRSRVSIEACKERLKEVCRVGYPPKLEKKHKSGYSPKLEIKIKETCGAGYPPMLEKKNKKKLVEPGIVRSLQNIKEAYGVGFPSKLENEKKRNLRSRVFAETRKER